MDFKEKIKLLLPEQFFKEGVRRFLIRLLGRKDITGFIASRPVIADAKSNIPIVTLRNCYKVGNRIVAIEDLQDDIFCEDRFEQYTKYLGLNYKILFVGIVSDSRKTYKCPVSEMIVNNRYVSAVNNNYLSAYNIPGMDFLFVTASEFLGIGPVKPFTVIDGKYCDKDLTRDDAPFSWTNDLVKYAEIFHNDLGQGGIAW